MSQPYSLTIYIDPRLLQDSTDLGNLCFARKVNGSYNVVFQGTANTLLTARNDFQWVENYAMGAVVKVVDGAHVRLRIRLFYGILTLYTGRRSNFGPAH